MAKTKQIASLDDYRHKLVEKILHANSFEQIKRFILTALRSLHKHQVNGHLVARFIDKAIDQFDGLSLLDLDIHCRLNAKYAKSQLEIIRRHTEESKSAHV